MRGDIFRIRPNDTSGHEQKGHRFGVVIQSDRLPLSTVLVAPTSTHATASDFRPRINLNGRTTFVMVEQTRAMNPETRFGQFVGRLEIEEMQAVDEALRLVFGLF